MGKKIRTPKGRYIIFEGGEGTGKSTQANKISERLKQQGIACQTVREPGGDAFSEAGRNLLLGDLDRTAHAEALIFNALRAQLLLNVVSPLLEKGTWVISDRGRLSTIVYQGHGRGADLSWVRKVCDHTTKLQVPDLEIVLDVDFSEAVNRRKGRGETDWFEKMGSGFHRKINEAYRQEAATLGLAVVDGQGSEDEVSDRLWQVMERSGMLF